MQPSADSLQNDVVRSVRPSLANRLAKHGDAALLLSLAIVIVLFSQLSEHFFTLRNITNVLGQASIIMVIALGVAIAMIGGEIDISVGSIVAAVAIPLVVVMNATESLALGLAAAAALGLSLGALNGFLAAYLQINSLIVTLGTMFIIRGGVFLYTGKRAIADTVYLDSFFNLGSHRVGGVLPVPAIVAGVIAVTTIIFMRHTRLGRKIYASGGNAEVARLAGYNVRKIKFIALMISAGMATVGGVLLSARLGSAVHLAGTGYEFQAVAAVVLGGVALAGGIGRLTGVVLGVLILAFVSNGLGQLNAPTEWQLIITGLVVIAAVALDARRNGGT